MRQILFKGFHANNNGSCTIRLNGNTITGEWVVGHYVACKDEYCDDVTHAIFTSECEHVCMGEYKDTGWYEVIPETICQFTGLYDKYGNAIWENDIVKCFDNNVSLTLQIVWNDKFAQFVLIGGFADFEREVVGNVFENV